MNYGSVCSGIEAATVAWDPLGWTPQWFSEIEPFPCKVLNYHYPHVPNVGDMLKIEKNEVFKKSIIDLLVGGTPCQSFSLAGLRGGLADERGNLALEFCRILQIKRPRWFVWENVPGVFSSYSNEQGSPEVEGTGPGNGRDFTETADFATLLNAFSECGYSCAWRVLDSQHFGVPQRRRRVFVVGHIGNDWRPPFAVLFERDSLRGNTSKGKKSREEVTGTIDASAGRSRGAGANPGMLTAGTLSARTTGGGFPGTDEALSGYIQPVAATIDAGARKSDRGESGNLLVVPPLNAGYGEKQGVTNQDIKMGLPHLVNGTWWDGGQTAQTLDAVLQKGQTMPEKNRFPAVLQPCLLTMREGVNGQGGRGPLISENKSLTLSTSNNQTLFHTMVRRLTPVECERLQGFPDNYTNIPGAKDGPRYKALGNSMTVNVMAWIGNRINKVDKIFHGS